MSFYEENLDKINAQAIRMLTANLEWLKKLEKPRQKETVDCGHKYQDKQEGI